MTLFLELLLEHLGLTRQRSNQMHGVLQRNNRKDLVESLICVHRKAMWLPMHNLLGLRVHKIV
jgi:hypothetical protein